MHNKQICDLYLLNLSSKKVHPQKGSPITSNKWQNTTPSLCTVPEHAENTLHHSFALRGSTLPFQHTAFLRICAGMKDAPMAAAAAAAAAMSPPSSFMSTFCQVWQKKDTSMLLLLHNAWASWSELPSRGWLQWPSSHHILTWLREGMAAGALPRFGTAAPKKAPQERLKPAPARLPARLPGRPQLRASRKWR